MTSEFADAYELDPDETFDRIRHAVMTGETAVYAELQSLSVRPELFRAEDRPWLPSALASVVDLAQEAAAADSDVVPLDDEQDLVTAALKGVAQPDADAVAVPVLFGHGIGGSLGTIRIRRLTSGPPGLFQDPESMLFRYCDSAFVDAVRTAWELEGLPEATVLWSVTQEGSLAFRGGSVGAQFALALAELKRRRSRFRRIRGALRGPRQPWVASAGLGSDGQLAPVSEILQKFEAAAKNGKRVILAAANKREGDHCSASLGVKVGYAQTVREAARIAWRPRRSYLAGLASVLVFAVLAGSGLFWLDRHDQQRAHISDLLNKVQKLQTLADQTGTGSVPDLQLRSLMLLAARSLALDAGRPDIADNVVNGAIPVSSAGVIGTLHDNLGEITAIHYLPGGDVAVSSVKGDLALYDPQTAELLGKYTEPPGAELLSQPQLDALVQNPHGRILAALFQVDGGEIAGVGHKAVIRVFSATTGGLTVLGSAIPSSAEAVTTMGYSPGGGTLLTVGAESVTFWDTTRAVPKELGRCTLPPGQRPFVGIYDDPVSHYPDLVENDTSILSLADWRYRVGSACSLGPRSAPWASDVADSAFRTPAVTVGRNLDGVTVVAALTKSGAVRVRTADGKTALVTPQQKADAIGEPGGTIIVESHAAGRPLLSLWNLNALTSTTLTPAFGGEHPDVALPAVDYGNGMLATQSGHVVQQLAIQQVRIPAGYITLGPPGGRNLSGVAAGTRAVALAHAPTGIAVYSLSTAQQGRFITFPDSLKLASGDNRQNSTLALSDDDRYLAAVVQPNSGLAGATKEPRRLLAWDLQTGMPVAVSAPFADAVAGTGGPESVTFLPGTDTLVTYTLNGAIYRMTPQATGLLPQKLRQAPGGGTMLGMDAGPAGILVFETAAATTGVHHTAVLLLDPEGNVRRSWDVTSLHLTQAQVAAVDDGGALVVDAHSMAYRLRPDGTVGTGVDLNAGVVVEVRQIPGTQTVLVGTSYAPGTFVSSEEYDLSKDIVNHDVNGARTPLTTFAPTSDGAFLVGTDQFDAEALLAALHPADKAASLCATAGRDLSAQEWAEYVGNVAPYRPLCSSANSDIEAMLGATRQANHLFSPLLTRTPSLAETARYESICKAPDANGYTTDGPFSWHPGATDTAICVSGALKWVVHATPHLQIARGGISGQPVLIISGQIPQSPAATAGPNGTTGFRTAFDVLGLNADDASSSVSGTGSITVDATGATITAVSGDLTVATKYGVDPKGDWGLLSQTPVAPA